MTPPTWESTHSHLLPLLLPVFVTFSSPVPSLLVVQDRGGPRDSGGWESGPREGVRPNSTPRPPMCPFCSKCPLRMGVTHHPTSPSKGGRGASGGTSTRLPRHPLVSPLFLPLVLFLSKGEVYWTPYSCHSIGRGCRGAVGPRSDHESRPLSRTVSVLSFL